MIQWIIVWIICMGEQLYVGVKLGQISFFFYEHALFWFSFWSLF